MDMRALALHKAQSTIGDCTADEPVDERVASHMEKYNAGRCAECKEACCNEDDPKLEIRLARYTCTEEGCKWVVCFLCANSLTDFAACKLCGGAYADADADDEEEWGEEEEEDNEDEEEDEEEEIEVTPAGRGGRSSNIGRGVGRGGSEARLSGTKRERTF